MASITANSQPTAYRILCLHIQARDEPGDWAEKLLIVEIMGRYSNILLTQGDTILDCIKHIGSDVNRYRELLPGKRYVPPPVEGRRDPFTIDKPLSVILGQKGDVARSQTAAGAVRDRMTLPWLR